MKRFGIEEFAAQRRERQDELIAELLPVVRSALEALGRGEEDWSEALARELSDLYATLYAEDGGDLEPDPEPFLSSLDPVFDETDPAASADLIAVWLSTAVLNAAVEQAAADDPEPVVLEWVTMRDEAVRATHAEAEGQQRAPGEMFRVGGHDMRRPGDPSAPIEEWANCRCMLRPALAGDIPFAHTENPVERGEDMPEETETTEEVAPMIRWHGVLAPEGVPSGDGRSFAPDSLRTRDLPLPLTWQKVSDDGHKGSVTVAVIERIERVDSLMKASGYFLQTTEADEVVGLIAQFGRYGVSIDADDAQFEMNEETGEVTFTSARIASASIVSIPAFAEAYVALGDWPEWEEELAASGATQFKRGAGWVTNPDDTKRLHDYWTKPGEPGYVKIGWGTGGDFNRCRVLVGEKIAENSPEDMRFINQICAQWHKDALGIWPGEHKASLDVESLALATGVDESVIEAEKGPSLSLVAGAGWCAPSEFFTDPKLTKRTALTITKEGRVFGHLAEWTTCHIGYDGVCVSPPRSVNDYAYFATGELDLTDGTVARVGQLTVGGGHAPLGLRARAAAAHYDNTCSAVADVVVGEDEIGIWFSGWIRPNATEDMVGMLRAAGNVSGDWREIRGGLELVAALAINVGGFIVPRVAASIQGGRQVALVAAGVVGPEEAAQEQVSDFARQVAREVLAEMKEAEKRRERMSALAARVKGQ